jgi:hypothetical protein
MTDGVTSDMRDDDATCMLCVRRKYDKLTVRENPKLVLFLE